MAIIELIKITLILTRMAVVITIIFTIVVLVAKTMIIYWFAAFHCFSKFCVGLFHYRKGNFDIAIYDYPAKSPLSSLTLAYV